MLPAVGVDSGRSNVAVDERIGVLVGPDIRGVVDAIVSVGTRTSASVAFPDEGVERIELPGCGVLQPTSQSTSATTANSCLLMVNSLFSSKPWCANG